MILVGIGKLKKLDSWLSSDKFIEAIGASSDMTVNVSESLFEQILEYLRVRTEASDRVAQKLLKTLETLTSVNGATGSAAANFTVNSGDRTNDRSMDRLDDIASQFGQKLFDAWKELADLQVGENNWSYPVMIEDIAGSPFTCWFGCPSCVPATSFETAGATIDADACARLLDDPNIHYLSEMMNWPGAIGADSQVMSKIAAAQARGKRVGRGRDQWQHFRERGRRDLDQL